MRTSRAWDVQVSPRSSLWPSWDWRPGKICRKWPILQLWTISCSSPSCTFSAQSFRWDDPDWLSDKLLTIIIKFGLVHHFTKMGSGEYYLEELENEICRKNDLDKSEKKRYRKSSFSLTKTVRYQFIIILQDILFTKWKEVRKAFLLHPEIIISFGKKKKLRGTNVRKRQSYKENFSQS